MVLTEEQLNDIMFEAVLDEYFDPDPELLEEGVLDWVQGGLDIIGLIPGIGEGADALNAIIGLVKGDFIEATFSAISMIPMAGDAVGKVGKQVYSALNEYMPWIQKFIDGAITVWDVFANYGRKLWDTLKKWWDKLAPMREFAIKKINSVKEFFTSIKSGSAKKLDAFLGGIIPDKAYGKVNAVLEKVKGKMEGVGEKIEGFLNFIGEAEEIMSPDEMPKQIPEEGGAEPGAVKADSAAAGGGGEKTLSGDPAPTGTAREKAIKTAGEALGQLGFSDIKNVAIRAVKAVSRQTNESFDSRSEPIGAQGHYSIQFYMTPATIQERTEDWKLLGKTIREGCEAISEAYKAAA